MKKPDFLVAGLQVVYYAFIVAFVLGVAAVAKASLMYLFTGHV